MNPANQLLQQLEALAARSYAEGEQELAFCLATTAGSFESGNINGLAMVFADILSSNRKTLILRTLASEAAKLNFSRN